LTISPLSPRELELARRSLQIIKEIDPSQRYENVENIEVHWMDSKKFAGITVYKSDGGVIIILDKSLRIKDENNPWDYVRLGAIYSHELSHALHGTKDPHTEQITDVRIWAMIRENSELTKRISKLVP
jgi:hypothetical protein